MSHKNESERAGSDPHYDSALDAAGRVAKVKETKSVFSVAVAWMIGIIIIGVMIFMIIPNQSHIKKNSFPSKHENDRIDNHVNDLIAALNVEEQQITPKVNMPVTPINTQRTSPTERQSSTDTPSRANFPSNVYTSSRLEAIIQKKRAHQGSTASPGEERKVFVGNDKNSNFANQNSEAMAVQAVMIKHPDNTVVAGEFIQATLGTAINSDLPGMVRAVTARPVYAYNGNHVIIPAGSRVIGQYSSAVVRGQSRVMIVWQRIILPRGVSIMINSPSTDRLGRAGAGADSIDTHFIERFGDAALLSLLSAGSASAGVGSADQYNSSAQYRAALAESFGGAAEKSIQETQSVKPTIHIHQGTMINIFVARDLDFFSVRHKHRSRH